MRKLLHGWSLILTLGLLAGMSSCSKDDAAAPATVNVGKNTLSFEAFATEAQTITVEANYDWTYTVTGDTQICDVTREEGSNTLTVTPKTNYDNVAHTAQIVITAGDGSNSTTQTITVSQAANSDTYLYILNAELSQSDNPIAVIQNNPDGGNTEYEINITTNNKLTVTYSDNKNAETTSLAVDKTSTRVAIEGCDWITYEVGEKQTTDGTVTVLTLSCTYNEDLDNSRTAYLNLVSGAGTQNKVVEKRIGVTQMANKPTIIANVAEEGLIATYDQSEPLTFSVAANIEYTPGWSPNPGWATFKEITEEGSEKSSRSFSVTVEPWYGTSDREATLQFVPDNEDYKDDAMTIVKVIQKAAPKASISLNKNSVTFNNGEESSTKYVEVTTTFSSLTVTTADNGTDETAAWLKASYDAVLGLALEVTGKTEKTRSATVTLTCGGDGNEASAKLTVTQLGTEPSLVLDPESVQLDSQGTEVVVNVYTNQSPWEILEASAETAFTLTPDKETNTIKVSASTLDVGYREHVYTIKAGELETKLTVFQRATYKVGDVYTVNGKPVGIVYQVDEQGMHGRAFSLTVHNINDLKMQATGAFVNTPPTSRTNGQENQQIIMQEPDWENNCQVVKWVADLAEKDGVNWYLPAIDELIDLVEYMTGIEFAVSEYVPNGGIPFKFTKDGEEIVFQENIDTSTKNWDIIRNLYKTYTNDAYYVVFKPYYWNEEGEAVMVDCRIPSTGSTPEEAGDERANVWLSSTIDYTPGMSFPLPDGSVYETPGSYNTQMVYFSESSVYEGTTVGVGNDWWEDYGGSIHPICQF